MLPLITRRRLDRGNQPDRLRVVGTRMDSEAMDIGRVEQCGRTIKHLGSLFEGAGGRGEARVRRESR